MLKATASKVMWVGRATVFMVGLSVIVAVVLGVATTALGATGGNFILGKSNGAGAITRLTSNIAGPALRLINNNSTSSAATALDLQVAAGHAPFSVNSSQKVANLNADQLDGKSETDFYAAGSKVADSELLDGIDSSSFTAYKRTVVVSPVGTDAENGQALLDAISNITDASASKPYLLHIEPATYDLGNGSLNMKPFVDIEGSGEINTVITSAPTLDECFPARASTVIGANNAEMRFLTVRDADSSVICSSAIYNRNASPRLTHLTAESTGAGSSNTAVFNFSNSNPTMTEVTATASGGEFTAAVYNQIASATIRQSELVGRVLVVDTPGSSVQCFNNYNENMALVTCP
jgi:hypothetical protein